ncbi:MAG: M48 family metalloprotease [Planctomycetaceae bacterium]|jgi:hypothetical protein|nr:M48 family metalloprotease [Planctomycetaceae bacterium]
MPKRIFVDCQINAFASFSHGFWGAFFGGNACDLTVGLPLVAGLNTSEFAGILAHEFGHFTQSGTRRMHYMVGKILGWFEYIYYYRDRLDGLLRAGMGLGYLAIPFVVIQAIVWIVRQIIWIFMKLGQFTAGFMSRQMEYDADSFEIRLCGSSQFGNTFTKLTMLSIANSKTINDISYMLNEDRLPDNYPLLIAANMNILGEQLKVWAKKTIEKSKSGFFDSHPSDLDRIAVAVKSSESGVLHVDRPASLFFRNFLALSREVSISFYDKEVGLKLESNMLKNADAVIDQLRREDLCADAVIQFFQRTAVARFLPLSSVEKPRDYRQAIDKLRKARDRQANFAYESADITKAYDEAKNKSFNVFFARELLRLGIKVDLSKSGLKLKSFADATQTAEILSAQLSAQVARVWNRDSAAAERLTCALELLRAKEINSQIEGGDALLKRMEFLFAILVSMSPAYDEFEQAQKESWAARGWFNMLSTLTQDKANALWRSVSEGADTARRVIKNFRTIFETVPYPFEHAKQETTLGMFLVPELNEVEWTAIDYYQAFDLLDSRLLATYRLMLGECLAIALAVEKAIGLEPLPVPPPSDEE